MNAVPLGEVTDPVMGQAPPGKACNKLGEGTIFVKAGEFSERFPVVKEWTTKPLKMAKRGDVLVCVVGATAGKVNQSIDCAIGRSVAAVRPRNDAISSDYLYHFLKLQTPQLRAKSQGLAQGVITREMLRNLVIPLPPLAEQKRIAAILDQADALRRLRRQSIDRLNTLAQSVFYEMFGELLMQPASFVRLSEIASKVTDGTHKTPKYVENGIKFVSAKNLVNNRLDLSDTKFITQKEHEEINRRCDPQDGDLIMSKSGALGSVAVFDSLEPCSFFESLALIKLDRAKAESDYVAEFLRTPFAQKQLKRATKGVAIKHLHLAEIKKMMLPLPALSRQKAFQDKIKMAQKLSNLFTRSDISLETLFASLQQRAFRGDL